ncbi:glycosyltransferase family 4 protein [cf. Phormidesmis sp. LEGE 11477]|uniref:glycosyltransferase family 4 protein n=1 Tax=cf. Phormidesmis sp. LEGE 11477 TaxID=1828680 RepID=UPI0018823118|nr:glycosyltransferase family 4 protein [cf. Phormidesmis sp. LEGE 11477]MBE9061359.1 glycosyltransferase family 4 protein [cf. Phormidesmis sp. LEGE 11477]
MRIAFVTPEYVTEPTYSGGLANYLGRVTVALVQAGHHVSVFTRSQTTEHTDFQGVKVYRVIPLWDRRMILDHIDPLIPRALYNPYQDLKAAWCLWKKWQQIHKEEAFDIVQVANVMAVGLFFRQVTQVPVVTRLSSYRPFWDRAAGIRENMGVKARWHMERLAITGCKNLYAPTYFVAKQVENGYSTPNVDVIETPFFPEQPTFDPSIFNEQLAGKSYALYFGRMTQMKGVHILAQALPKVLLKYPDMYMVFVGGEGFSPEGTTMREYIIEQLKAFENRVIFIESIRHDKLYPIVKGAKIVVLPSLIDNLPNTCLESMGLGKVVVATTGSCFEQVIEHDTSGILVEPSNPERLADGIAAAWTLDDNQRSNMQRRAVESVTRLHPDKAIPKLISYYQELLKTR